MVDKKNYILTKVNELNIDQYMEIFKIIHENDIKYTVNNNGVFIDLGGLKKRIINKIYNYINYCIKNKKILSKRLHRIKKEEENLKQEINDNYKNEADNVIQDEYNMTGNKIILKKKKIEYSKTKSKIIKNYNETTSIFNE
tara:strand:- start:665 stop:1087 length:423 start_codon:yes stop_codon:yes gene_type:complete